MFSQIFNILSKFIDCSGGSFQFLYTVHTRNTSTTCTGLPSYVTVNDVAYLHTGTRPTYVANFTNPSTEARIFNVFSTCEVLREVRTGHVKPVHRSSMGLAGGRAATSGKSIIPFTIFFLFLNRRK